MHLQGTRSAAASFGRSRRSYEDGLNADRSEGSWVNAEDGMDTLPLPCPWSHPPAAAALLVYALITCRPGVNSSPR